MDSDRIGVHLCVVRPSISFLSEIMPLPEDSYYSFIFCCPSLCYNFIRKQKQWATKVIISNVGCISLPHTDAPYIYMYIKCVFLGLLFDPNVLLYIHKALKVLVLIQNGAEQRI